MCDILKQISITQTCAVMTWVTSAKWTCRQLYHAIIFTGLPLFLENLEKSENSKMVRENAKVVEKSGKVEEYFSVWKLGKICHNTTIIMRLY